MAKMVWYCHNCGTVLPLWRIKCPNCHRTTMSVLQIGVIVLVAVPAVFLLLKVI